MAKVSTSFRHDVLGKSFIAAGNGARFTVDAIDPYPADKVSKGNVEILSLPTGVLVSVQYRGILIPNITVEGGVVRLTQVTTSDGRTLSGPKAISAALGIEEAFKAYGLTSK